MARPVREYGPSEDLLGNRYGYLLVIDVERIKDRWWYTCECKCGKVTKARRDKLIMLQHTSCGCDRTLKRNLFKQQMFHPRRSRHD